MRIEQPLEKERTIHSYVNIAPIARASQGTTAQADLIRYLS